jgi:hypothetical protein
VSHLVIYDIDGIEQFVRVVTIDEAVAIVERVRNEGNSSARIYRLDEIQFEVKAYFRVEVGTPSDQAVPVASEPNYEVEPAEVEPTGPVAVTSLAPPPELEQVLGAGATLAALDDFAVSSSLGGARRGLFGR